MREDKLKTICTFDPAVRTHEMDVSEMVKFAETRDWAVIRPYIDEEKRPTVFHIREIPASLWSSFVLAVDDEGERCLRAFRAAVFKVENKYDDDGQPMPEWSGTEYKKATNGKARILSQEEAEEFSPAEWLEIGNVCYFHSFLPRRIASSFQLAPSSLGILTRLTFRDADANPTDAPENSSAHSETDPPASPAPTASTNGEPEGVAV